MKYNQIENRVIFNGFDCYILYGYSRGNPANCLPHFPEDFPGSPNGWAAEFLGNAAIKKLYVQEDPIIKWAVFEDLNVGTYQRFQLNEDIADCLRGSGKWHNNDNGGQFKPLKEAAIAWFDILQEEEKSKKYKRLSKIINNFLKYSTIEGVAYKLINYAVDKRQYIYWCKNSAAWYGPSCTVYYNSEYKTVAAVDHDYCQVVRVWDGNMEIKLPERLKELGVKSWWEVADCINRDTLPFNVVQDGNKFTIKWKEENSE